MDNIEIDQKNSYLQPDVTRPHSKLGIASFIISIAVSGLLILIIFMTVTIIGDREAIANVDKNILALVGLFVVCSSVISLINIGLGIVGVMRKNKKKVFAILGILISVANLVTVAYFLT